jgi:hypothetical protein
VILEEPRAFILDTGSFKLPKLLDLNVVTSFEVGIAGLNAKEFNYIFEFFLPLAYFDDEDSSLVLLCNSIFDPRTG